MTTVPFPVLSTWHSGQSVLLILASQRQQVLHLPYSCTCQKPFPAKIVKQSGIPMPFLPPSSLSDFSVLLPLLHYPTAEREREMKCSSRVVMGATIAMVAILAFVLTLVLLLLAELYCSLLLGRRKLKPTKPDSNPENPSISEAHQAQEQHSLPSPLSGFYAQGVLDAPRSFLFPKLPSKRKEETRNSQNSYDVEKQKHGKLHQFLRIHSPSQIGLRSSSSSPSPTYISFTKPPKPSQTSPKSEIEVEVKRCSDEASSDNRGDLLYISNPIYDNDVVRPGEADTPFQTPGSSPTRSDRNGSAGEEGMQVGAAPSSPPSLPLTPMKELPPKACSVELKDGRSGLGGCGTGSESNHSHIGRTTSSSGSPCTSPSW